MGWPGRAQRPTTTVEQDGEASKLKELTMHTHQRSSEPVATIGLDIGKNTFHLVGLDKRGLGVEGPPAFSMGSTACGVGDAEV
jgi:hypothetical protein